jgi:hypothetical protein
MDMGMDEAKCMKCMSMMMDDKMMKDMMM